MSCYTYYGKLKDELFVAVLPNGTVEIDDPVELFSQKQLRPYRVKDVSITEDGEDRFTFHDGYYAFEGVTSKAYKSIDLTRKTISNGETSSISLTRQYEQPRTATPQNGLKIWTGTMSFHEWANNESFVVVAPKGVGKDLPIVALWQWTKDAKGTPKTLSYGSSKQISDAGSPEKFSFKQNDYYTLVCQVNATSKGLKVTVKAPTNGDKEQKELTWAPTGSAAAEHRFSPPRARQEKITLECSFPNAKPSLPRITSALPFPTDLVDTLSYSAAYLDQAGYLAKYAVKQFEKLDRSYHLLEKKAEARATKIVKLEADNGQLKSDNEGLKKRNDTLQKQIDDDRKEAAKREADLEEKLRKALAALKTSEQKAERLGKENGKLKEHIAKDLCEDIEREARHKAHDEADHKAIDLANEQLCEARELGKRLKKELDSKNSIIAALEADLDATKRQLKCAEAEIVRLKGELAIEREEKMELLDKNDDLEHKLYKAEQDLQHLRTEIANTKAELAAEQKKNTELSAKLNDTECQLKKALRDGDDARNKLVTEQKKSADLGVKLSETEKKLKKAVEDVQEARDDFTSLDARYKELKEENDSISAMLEGNQTALEKAQKALKETKDRANAADTAHSELSKKFKDAKAAWEAELETFKKNVGHTTVQDVKSDITATVAEVTL